jgi:PAS domain-containing protein
LTPTNAVEDWLLRVGGLRFTQLLDSLPEAITIRSADDQIVFANQAALTQFAVESIEQLRARTTESRLGDHSLHDERGAPLMASDLPSATAVRREAPEPLLVRAVDRRTGDVRWWRMKSLPLLDIDDRLIGASTVIEDLTPVKTAEIRTRVLAESGGGGAGSPPRSIMSRRSTT